MIIKIFQDLETQYSQIPIRMPKFISYITFTSYYNVVYESHFSSKYLDFRSKIK